MSRTVVVVAALLVRDGRLLIAQRPEGKKRALQWEFPGGKAEAGETPEEALRREIREELGIEVALGRPTLEVLAHEYPDIHVEVHFIPCAPLAEPERREHAALAWVGPDELARYDFVEADVAVLPRIADALRAGRL